MSSNELLQAIELTVAALKKGQVILYPTDTIWGIGCDTENKSSVERVQQIKKNKEKGNLVILVNSIMMLRDCLISVHPRIETLLVYHKKPLTIIYDNPNNLPNYLISSDGTVAIRVSQDPFIHSIIDKFGRPIVSTSASLDSTKKIPSDFESIDTYIKEEVDFICPYKNLENMDGHPSVMARYNRKGDLEFLRS